MSINYFQMFHDATREHAESLGATMNHTRYFLAIDDAAEREVSMDEFIRAERAAGFHPKPGCGPVATTGFSGTICEIVKDVAVWGRIEYADRPIHQAIKADEARHMRAPMHEGDVSEWITLECACGMSENVTRRLAQNPDDPDFKTFADDTAWRIERCDGSSCGIENCGRMVAKCGRCRS